MSERGADLIRLTIDGRRVEVVEGTTLAGALAIAGRLATRVSVSGEARAPWCGMGVCQECRVTVDGRAHVLACQILCRDGQRVETPNGGNGRSGWAACVARWPGETGAANPDEAGCVDGPCTPHRHGAPR